MDKIAELKSLLAKAWHVAYQLEKDAKEAGDQATRDFFFDLNGVINSLEVKVMDFEKAKTEESP